MAAGLSHCFVPAMVTSAYGVLRQGGTRDATGELRSAGLEDAVVVRGVRLAEHVEKESRVEEGGFGDSPSSAFKGLVLAED